jgi:hypothetical protein
MLNHVVLQQYVVIMLVMELAREGFHMDEDEDHKVNRFHRMDRLHDMEEL